MNNAKAVDCFVNNEKNIVINFDKIEVAIDCIDDYTIKIIATSKNKAFWDEKFTGDTPYIEVGKVTSTEFMLLINLSSNNNKLLVFDTKNERIATVLDDVGRVAIKKSNGDIAIDQYASNGISYVI